MGPPLLFGRAPEIDDGWSRSGRLFGFYLPDCFTGCAGIGEPRIDWAGSFGMELEAIR